MKRNLIYIIIALLAISVFAEPSQVENKSKSSAPGIVPSMMLRGYDPVTLFFRGTPGPAKGGPADNPGKLMQITPQHPGEFIWVDGSTLQFLPSEPWTPLTRYSISSGKKKFTLITMMEAPVKPFPTPGSRNLKPFKEFRLNFRGRIKPEKLAMMITMELHNLNKGSVSWLTFKDFTIMETERSSVKQLHNYRIILKKPIPSGTGITMHIRLSLNSEIPDSLIKYRYTTAPPFRLLSVSSGSNTYPLSSKGSEYTREQAMVCKTDRQELTLNFSKDVSRSTTLSEIKNLVRFSPDVKDFKYRISGKRVIIGFKSLRDKHYKLTLRYTDIKGENRKPLELFKTSGLYFKYQSKTPYLSWSTGNVILERYGPQILPMKGRNSRRVDFRIYKIDPLNRNFWPFPAKPVSINDNLRPPGPGEEPAYGSNLREHIKLLGSPLVSEIADMPEAAGRNSSAGFGMPVRKFLEKISGINTPGTYLAGFRTIGSSSNRSYIRFQVTDLALTLIEDENSLRMAVTSLRTGKPVQGATVQLESSSKKNIMTVQIRGVSDANGFIRYTHKKRISEEISRIVVKKGRDILTINPHTPPPGYMDNHWYYNWNLWLKWLTTKPAVQKSNSQFAGLMLTERPVYKPGETVHIKTFSASRKAGVLKALKNRKCTITIHGPGSKSWTFKTTTSRFGTSYLKFRPGKDVPTGHYTAYLRESAKGVNISYADFKIENYRIPKFEIRFSSPEQSTTDSPFKVDLSASYYAGGPVINRKVEWKINRRLFIHKPDKFRDFLFSSNRRYSREFVPEKFKTITRETTTDGKGISSISIDPSEDPSAQSRSYILEATIRGADKQTVTAVKEIKSYSPFLLGLKCSRLIKNKMVIEPEIVVLNHKGELHKEKNITVTLYHRQWHSHLKESDFTTGKTRYITDVVDKKLSSETIRFKGKKLKIPFNVKEAGVYLVEISARDKLGRRQKVTADLFVKGKTDVAWEKPEAGIFSVTSIKSSYKPGEQAEIVLKSPYQKARVLAISEIPGETVLTWIKIEKGQGLYTIPVTSEMSPGIPVHFLLMKGRTGKSGSIKGEDRNRPVTLAATKRINVKPVNNQLKIEFRHNKRCLPGSKLKIRIELKNYKDIPESGEVTLWMVDRAVLALGKEQFRSPLKSMITPHRSWIRARGTRNLIRGYINPEEVPGGDGSLRAASAAPGIFKKETVRKNFMTVPYYNPSVIVENGVTEIEIQMPDNLTDFAIRAIAATGTDKYGITGSEVSVRLPLIVQPAMPRFIRNGDSFKAGAIGRAVEGENGPGSGYIATDDLKISGSRSFPVQWIKGEPVKLWFNMHLPLAYSKTSVRIKSGVKRDTDNASDAFEISVPVKPDIPLTVKEEFSALKSDQNYKLPLPSEKIRSGTFRQKIVVARDLFLIKSIAALNYLGGYSHHCTEQRISRLIPELELKKLLTQLNIRRDDKGFRDAMDDTFRHLEQSLNSRGLYGYWPGSRGYVNITAMVVEFLLKADKAGFRFKPYLLSRGITALKEALRSDYSYFIKGEEYKERVMALHALSQAGIYDPSYAEELYRSAKYMDLKSEADILITILNRAPDNKKAIAFLTKDIRRNILLKLENGKEVFHKLSERGVKFHGLIPENSYEILAGIAVALFKADSSCRELKAISEYLIKEGGESGWGSTRANAAVLRYMSLLNTKKAEDFTAELTTNGKSVKEFSAGKPIASLINTSTDNPVIKISAGSGNKAYLWILSEYIPDTGGRRAVKTSSGFVVNRLLKIYSEKESVPVRKRVSPSGRIILNNRQIVEEEVTVINPADRNFVAVRVPFAAGCEPMNPNLSTSPSESKTEGRLTLAPTYSVYGDDSVTFYYDYLNKGTYKFFFRLKPITTGNFTHPPAEASLMYRETVKGRSSGTTIIVEESKE